MGKQAHHCNALRLQKCINVDTAGIERKKMPLPGEIFVATSWQNEEVSRSHST